MVARQTDPPEVPGTDPLPDDLPVAAITVDPAGDRIIQANAAAGLLVGTSPESLLVPPLSSTLTGDNGDAEITVGDRTVAVSVIGPDGWRDADGPVTLVLLDRLQLTLAAIDDDRLRDECQELRQQLAQARTRQERLVSVWAHELKTPLTIVQSYLEILTGDLDEGLSEEQLSFLTITKDSVLRLRRLVLDLVDLLALRSGHLSIETATVDVARLLDDITDEMQPLADEAEVELVHERPAIRVAIRADEDRVRQIVRNLLDNAFKFTPPGGRVTVRTRVETSWVTIDVVDNGAGIPADALPKIFEEFVQLPPSGVRRRQRGSGLGLAISQQIAVAHGGAIEVESEVGSGSVFSVRLPREHNVDSS
ncbi:MAG: HAMP domain-containing sensor histidine kinase [Holophagae bacterium]|jgi:signal transduction histidine kinase